MMFIDILRIADDKKSVCYISERNTSKPNIYLVNKENLTVDVIVEGDNLSVAGCMRKITKSISHNDFPLKILLATGW